MTAQDPSPVTALSGQGVHHQLGALTRQLHDSLNGLGLTSKVQNLAGELPDAKSRLTYIARLTGDAAEKVLSRVELAKVEQARIQSETQRISQLLAAGATIDKDTLQKFVESIDQAHGNVDQHLTDIMMAQDFHDLTGQVIAKVVGLAAVIEEQLVQLLIQTAPPEVAVKTPAPQEPYVPALDGPVVDGKGNPNVVTSQSQVDDLLASLGF